MLNVKPLSIHIGAEIHDVNLTKPLATDQISDIKAALLQWKVVFFRNQPLNHRQHIDFARQFGEPTPGHVVFGGDKTYPEIYSIAKERTANRNRHLAPLRPWTGWHTDITAAINPPWAAAFASLSPALQKFVETLHAEHRLALGEQTLASIHPLVRVHPETGERVLYVSPSFVKSVTGLKPHESQKLLELLWEQAIRPEYTVRFKWEPGSIAFWDNRSTAHLAPADIFDSDFERQFYRVTLVGDVPVGVDGKLSRSVTGNPIGAAAKPSVESSA